MFDRLRGSGIFDKIDLRSGYRQLPLREQATPATAFWTRRGLFEYLILPFGLTNAPAQYTHLMNNVLQE